MNNKRLKTLLIFLYTPFSIFSIWFATSVVILVISFIFNVMFGCHADKNGVCIGSAGQIMEFERTTYIYSFIALGLIIFLYRKYLKKHKDLFNVIALLSFIITVPMVGSFLLDFLGYLWSL